MEEGQTIELDYLPDTGTEVRIAGQRRGTVTGVDFNHAMLRIWLGPKPPTDDLKNEMQVA
ncbi:MAG: chalcone isomerase family protein [Gammaproteobacteria bacterium]